MLLPYAPSYLEPSRREIQPDEINDWLALGGAIAAGAVWLWRKTIKAFCIWFWNGLKAPQRIEQILSRLDLMQHDLTTAVGLARATWDTLPCAVWQSDSMGLCIHVNRAYREILGYQFSEVSGLGWKQVIYDPDRERVFEEWESSVKEKRPFSLRYHWISKSGEIIPVHAAASVLHDAKGNVIGWVAFVTDLRGKESFSMKPGKHPNHNKP